MWRLQDGWNIILFIYLVGAGVCKYSSAVLDIKARGGRRRVWRGLLYFILSSWHTYDCLARFASLKSRLAIIRLSSYTQSINKEFSVLFFVDLRALYRRNGRDKGKTKEKYKGTEKQLTTERVLGYQLGKEFSPAFQLFLAALGDVDLYLIDAGQAAGPGPPPVDEFASSAAASAVNAGEARQRERQVVEEGGVLGLLHGQGSPLGEREVARGRLGEAAVRLRGRWRRVGPEGVGGICWTEGVRAGRDRLDHALQRL